LEEGSIALATNLNISGDAKTGERPSKLSCTSSLPVAPANAFIASRTKLEFFYRSLYNADHMKMTIRWNRFASYTVLVLCLQSIYSGWAQNKTGDAVSPSAQAEGLLDLLGDLPNPRRIDVSDLHRLPRVEARTTDPHDPGKEIVYSGTPLVETLKAGGLLLVSGMGGLRETVKMTVIVEATDGYRAVFSSAELDPELTDRIILLADTKDGQPLPLREGPLRIIVPGEKRPARWVRQVKALTVRKN
jgi:DMSO/TMAO reductase YedYZ molybdopterin-dependent catalytic subunit